MKILFPACGLLIAALSISPINAAIDPSIVPADARWVIYADLNALRASAVGKELVAAAEKAQFEQHNAIGLDLKKVMTTIGTVTAYGSNFSPDPKALDGTLILQGTPDLKKIAESVLLQATIAQPKSFSEVTDLPFPAYSIRGKSADASEQNEVIVAFPPEPIVVVSKSRPQLLKARDLFRDHANSIAKAKDASLAHLLQSSDGAFVFATSVVPSETMFPEDQPQARILRMTRSGAIALGEQDGKTFARAELVATSDEMADKLQKILEGMIAAVSLTETNDKQLADFLNSATVTRAEKGVKLSLAYSSDRLAQMLHSMIEEHKPAHAESPEQRTEKQNAELYNGEALGQWQAQAVPEGEQSDSPKVLWHAIEKVSLKNGAIISLGRQSRGGRSVKFDRVEIVPTEGGSPLTFQTQFMTAGGPRNTFKLFQFPGADGSYTIKVAYANDPEGKAVYTVSVRQPKAPAAPTTDANAD